MIKAAVVVELTHVASLYHDDVMDEARLRRGSDSANARWGNTVAILVGDFLFARASDIVADLGPEFVRLQARTFSRLVQGQIAETRRAGSRARPARPLPAGGGRQDRLADRHLRAVRRQAVRRRRRRCSRRWRTFGEQIGVVFQLSDDIIDITSDETGKTPGTDLREGIPTLPTLLARRSTDPADARLLELLDSDLRYDAALAEALALLRRHRCIDEARAEVRRRADRARAAARTPPARPRPLRPRTSSATRSSPAPPDPPEPIDAAPAASSHRVGFARSVLNRRLPRRI